MKVFPLREPPSSNTPLLQPEQPVAELPLVALCGGVAAGGKGLGALGVAQAGPGAAGRPGATGGPGTRGKPGASGGPWAPGGPGASGGPGCSKWGGSTRS